MAVSPTLNRAARILALVSPQAPADAVLRRELAPRRDLAPSERREIARAIAAYFRWLNWLDSNASPQRRVEAALEWQARFDTNPAAIKPEALAARAVPEWLASEMDIIPAAWLRELQCDPALWIRVRRQFLESLPRALGDCAAAVSLSLTQAPRPSTLDPLCPTLEARPSTVDPCSSSIVLRPSFLDASFSTLVPRLSTAFRYTGPRDLYLTNEFQRGQFEIQDLASQLVGWACNPQPGEMWWDACAGEGGKMLHLADLMQNKGLIWASDRSMRRLKILKQRAARAGVFNYRAVPWNGGPQPPTRTRFDGILVDAPCSGVGTWQRNPHARWTISPTDVRELAAVQRQLLDHVVGALKPGGRLIYAVCTLTRAETSRVAAEFSRSHPELEPVPVFPTAGIPVQASEGQPTGTEPPRPMNDACSGSDQISGAGQSDFMGGTPMPCGTGAPPVSSSERLDPDLRPSGSPVPVQLWPQDLKANSMFIAAWRLQSARLQST